MPSSMLFYMLNGLDLKWHGSRKHNRSIYIMWRKIVLKLGNRCYLDPSTIKILFLGPCTWLRVSFRSPNL